MTDNNLIQRKHVPTNEGLLRIPFFLNIRDIGDDEVLALMERVSHTLDASHFRGPDLTMEVLKDYRARAAVPRNFLYGPYLGVLIVKEGVVRINVAETVKEGSTVYALDQLESFLAAIESEGQESSRSPRPRG